MGVVLNEDQQLQGLDEYRMEDVILYNVPQDQLVDEAEHLFSLLLRSYIWMGGLNAEVGSIQDNTKNFVPGIVWRKWEEKLDFGVIQQCFTEDGQHFENKWKLISAVTSAKDNKIKRDDALALAKTREQEMQDAKNAQVVASQEVEKVGLDTWGETPQADFATGSRGLYPECSCRLQDSFSRSSSGCSDG